ncbi:aspartate aminotransferase family protein [Rhodopila sp.]|uniref:aspartate aminotransferase family protein n=1 Tax=Rhodopila sp. TaxID=2480087 RepID=UPI002C702A79|nr:aminotransferase class III-fold pyridoxal phosphate-dependent enzyme [Rhodopila sp.]HVZ08428.1 aminotransferase class III-fold pyridoxal phosphate-dependent enzyme [Rhodopila sp.]
MSASTLPNATLTATYEAMTPGSAALAGKARELLPSGIAHDSRNFDPYPLYIQRALGPVKWDVDNNKYVDYFGGHGALILGHNHPAVMAAVHAALDRGTHFGACHELEVRWAELITRMVPSAERVRFTSSGTEATLMALRLARACTGREKIVRFRGHFHGWNDHMTSGYSNHFDGTPTSGVVHGLSDSVLLCDPNDVDGITRLFNDHKDIAAVIIEPTGASFGKMPILPSFLQVLRDLTRQAGTILIFDEVVTGFRVSRGGMQAACGIIPDMTTLAKIVAGGLPGGAVVGKKALLDWLDFKVTTAKGLEKIYHPGTFNANPVSAAAGIATLETLQNTDANDRANAFGAELRRKMNEVLEDEGVKWAVYGTYSGIHVYTNPDDADITPSTFNALDFAPSMLGKARGAGITSKVRMGMLVNGVDMNSGPSGTISATHGDEEMAITVDAFRATIRSLRREGLLA